LALDFTNTVDEHQGDRPVERLATYADLVAWCRHVETLSAAQAERLLASAASSPDAARAVLAQALALREAAFGIFSAATRGEATPAADLGVLNASVAAMAARSRIDPTGDGHFGWHWGGDDAALDLVLWAPTRDAADLLTSQDLHRVRQCSGAACDWLFLDTSRNGLRRWCSMEDCGNRAKARRHYRRQQMADASPVA
jgi:predicted RNA-binding Zn ribbon-like protein